jgi:hypothetical protein
MSKNNQHSRRDVLALLGSATAFGLMPSEIAAQQTEVVGEIPETAYTVADTVWPYLGGNHRVRMHVAKAGAVVRASIPWRRVDPNPEQKAVLVFNAQDVAVQNVFVERIAAFAGEIYFEAATAGDYFLYFLPHKEVRDRHSAIGPKGQYLAPQSLANAGWLQQAKNSIAAKAKVPLALVIEFEARSVRDSFFPMEVPASEDEVAKMRQHFPGPALLFAEDRQHPIKMYEQLPLRWVRQGPLKTFSATALRGEFYVMQLGIYAGADSGVTAEKVALQFHDLVAPNGERIAGPAWMCLNTDGVDVAGKSFHKEVHADAGKVLPLWCGVQVPMNCKPGIYKGTITAGMSHGPLTVEVALEVKADFIRARGDDLPEHLSRIAWLNSDIGVEGTRTAPYTPLELQERAVNCLGRTVTFGESGFPASIKVKNEELLAAPIELKVYKGVRALDWKSRSSVTHSDDAVVVLKSSSTADGFELDVETTMEFDGGTECEVTLRALRSGLVAEIALEIPYFKNKVPYAVGMNLQGGYRPAAWQWKWSDQKPGWKEQGSNLEYFLWLGSVESGLFCRLKSPLLDWRNDGKGGASFSESGERVEFRATAGARLLHTGEVMHFSFRLLPTPVKPLDPNHWNYRYAHTYQPPEELKALDATVINIHQGKRPNLYINYPFLNLDLLGPYVNEAHSLNMKVKLYYTMRELTTWLPELWTFRSLGDEIYRVGGTQGQGNPQLDFWLQEHLHSEYSPGWIEQLSNGEIDSSLRIKSDSRLANFYLEGLKWLVENVPIDGLYLDEIGYSRSTMQRVRRVLQQREGAMIDMHGNHDWWSCNCPIAYYMEHLPYIDRLWLGEGFNPELPADFWLIEMSGLPFGLSSDLLEHPNPWRGMLFGMTDRALYTGPSPTPIWNLWGSFGIESAEMIGWWNDAAVVKTKNDAVFATAYVKPGKCLIAVASWSKKDEELKLEMDWAKLGMDSARAKLTAPALDGMQPLQHFSPGQTLNVTAGKGYLLLLEQA